MPKHNDGNQNKKMPEIIDLSSVRFPVGTKAWHSKYHVCYIVESLGMQRTIKSICKDKIEIEWEYNTVHMNELKTMKAPIGI